MLNWLFKSSSVEVWPAQVFSLQVLWTIWDFSFCHSSLFVFILRDRSHLWQLLLSFYMFRVSLKSLFKSFLGRHLHLSPVFLRINTAEFIVGVRILIIPSQTCSEIEHGLFFVSFIVVGRGQIEIALGTVRFPFKRHQVRIDWVIVLPKHIVCIAQIVECRRVVWIQLNRLLVHIDRLSKLFNDAVCIAQIVISLGFFRV